MTEEQLLTLVAALLYATEMPMNDAIGEAFRLRAAVRECAEASPKSCMDARLQAWKDEK